MKHFLPRTWRIFLIVALLSFGVLIVVGLKYKEYTNSVTKAVSQEATIIDGKYDINFSTWDPQLGSMIGHDGRKAFLISDNGSTVSMLSNPFYISSPQKEEPGWIEYFSYKKSSWFDISDDFEIHLTLKIGEDISGMVEAASNKLADDFKLYHTWVRDERFSPVLLLEFFNPIDKNSLAYGNHDRLLLLIDKNKISTLAQDEEIMSNQQNNPAIVGESLVKLPDSGEIILRMERVAETSNEIFSIIDAKTGISIISIPLLFKFFKDNRKLCLGFQVRPAINLFSLSQMRIISLQ